MKKKALLALALIALAGGNCEAAETEHYTWTVVHATYVAEENDTLDSITAKYIQRNTYGVRDFNEFKEGIKELNEWLLKREVRAGDQLRINYWETVKK